MIELKNLDCKDLFKEIPDESIDCVVTDPPYRITARGTSSTTMGGFMTTEIARVGKIFEDNCIEFCEYLPELYRVLKNGTHCYIMINNVNLQDLLNEATKCGFKFVQDIIWDKQNKICGQWYMGCYEHILLFRKGEGKPINNPSTPNILSIPVKKLKSYDGGNLHDTEKPVELMKILVENSTSVGETVMDPFSGIGSTALACKKSGRNFIGSEINPQYYNVAISRLNGDILEKREESIELW